MDKISALAVRVKELEDQLAVCMRCGMCQAVCPLFEQTGRETDVARGKLALLSGLMSRMFDDPRGVADRLNKCLLCGACAANCPSGVNVLDIFIRARAILTEYAGLSAPKKLVLRQVLSNPERFNTVVGLAEKFQGMMVKSRESVQGTSCARFGSPLLSGRHFLPLAKNPFHRCRTAPVSAKGHSGPRVVLFTGCLIDKLMPDIGHAVVKVMAHHRVNLLVPETQGCCGIPALASGDRKTFDTLVSHHIRLFKKQPFDYLITACATCTSTVKKLWPSVFKGAANENEYIKELCAKTMDVNQFLVDVIKVPVPDMPGEGKEAVTYHDPCHLKKSLGIFAQPRTLIRAAGHPLKEMAAPDKCCGMGGSFNLFHYEISMKIGSIKRQNIVDTGCPTVASGCPACIMQISDMLSRKKDDIKVVHPVQLYARHLDNDDPAARGQQKKA